MVNIQYEVFYPSMRKPEHIDTTHKVGVHYVERPEALVTPVMAEVQRIMAEIRATGKCGMFVARWDGQAWCFHVCAPPARINET